MGADIHSYLQLIYPPHGGRDYAESFGEVDIGRNYALFGLMSGVRGGEAIVEPKGLPPVLSFKVDWEYHLYVSDRDGEPGEHECSRENAKSWVKSGCSKWANEEHTRVTHPDWHSASWLSTEELEEVYAEYRKMAKKEKNDHRLTAVEMIIAAMQAAEKGDKSKPKVVPQLVFWFDN